MNLPPQIVVIAGPNGAGKSTTAPVLVPPGATFLNADEIAKVLRSEHETSTRNATMISEGVDTTDIQAGRLLLSRLNELEALRADIAIETTLASRSLAPRLTRLRESGYLFSLFYIWLPDPDLCVARVAERVRRGGHHIPEETIRRRYKNGIRNFINLYQPIADRWLVLNNREIGNPSVVAWAEAGSVAQIYDGVLWSRFLQETAHE